MSPDDLERFARRFAHPSFSAKPKQAPKLGLSVLQAARAYRAAFEAAESTRRSLVAEVLRRHPDPPTALDALAYLADSFDLPPFTRDDLTRGGPG